MKYIKILILFTAIVLLAACSSTKVTSSWKSPDATAVNLSVKKIMVAALLPDKDRELQKSMENKLVQELNAKGINAVSAYATYGPKYFPQNEEKAISKLQEAGVDGVLTVVLLDKNKERTYNPGSSRIAPVGFYRNWYGYYRTVYGRVYTPGYYTSADKFYWESNLYDLNPEKLLYSAQSQSFDPSSIGQLSNDYSEKILSDMTKQGLVAKK